MNPYLNIAYTEAKKAELIGEVPVGAVIVKNNIILAKAHNKKETLKDPTAHAELLAIQKACKKIGNWRLLNCDIYVTLEPCAMCAAAILHARINNVYYGVTDSKWGGETSLQLFSNNKFNHNINYKYLPSEKLKKQLKQFFKTKRNKKETKKSETIFLNQH